MQIFGRVLWGILKIVIAVYALLFMGIRAAYRRWPKPVLITAGALAGVFVVSALVAGITQGVSGPQSASSLVVASTAAPSPSADDTAAEPEAEDPADDGQTSADLSGGGAGTASRAVAGDAAGATAREVLATLPIKGRAAKTGYARDQFGAGWKDPDRNGCDARNDMLARDLTGVVTQGGCKVLSGTLDDPYTGLVINFVRGNTTSTAVQIDHVVALSNAWQTGAQQLSSDKRVQLANDPLNLQSVDGPTNQKKGAGDAATWLPPNKTYRCEYVARQVSVKAAYGLWVTQAEHDAIDRILDTCPDQQAYQSTLAPYGEPVAPQADEGTTGDAGDGATTTQPDAPSTGQSSQEAQSSQGDQSSQPESGAVPDTGSVYYQNCAAVRAAGKAPLYAGQPGYEAPRLDRDLDGVACE